MPGTSQRSGLVLGMAAYLMWGVLPLAFAAVDRAGPFEVVAHRVIWSLAFCLLLLALMRGFRRTWVVLRDRRTMGLLVLATCFIMVNWLVFIYAAQTDRVLQASLGYFINPLVTVALGVLVLKEKLRPAQWAAVGIGLLAVIAVAVGYGQLPWISITLAVSFGLYGLVKNRVGRAAGALESFTIETMIAFLPALAFLVWLISRGESTFLAFGTGHTLALIALGVVTTLPLLCFNAAARRIPLVWMGMVQYLAPICQFILAIAVFHEELGAGRWLGFILIWVALIVLTTDMVLRQRRNPRRRPGPDEEPNPPVG